MLCPAEANGADWYRYGLGTIGIPAVAAPTVAGAILGMGISMPPCGDMLDGKWFRCCPKLGTGRLDLELLYWCIAMAAGCGCTMGF